MRRVVVTGLGMVTPLGSDVETTWSRLIAGDSGASQVTAFDVSDLACRIACSVPFGDGSDGTFNPDRWMEAKEQRKVDPFIVYAMAAAGQALDDAGWHPKSHEDQCATGVMIGSGIGGIGGIYDASVTLHDKGPRRISPFFIPGRIINLASGQVSIAHGLKGPNHAVVTACFHRRPCHRRRGPADPVRRCRRHGGGWCRISGEPPRARWLRRLPRPLHRFQRPADQSFAPL